MATIEHKYAIAHAAVKEDWNQVNLVRKGRLPFAFTVRRQPGQQSQNTVDGMLEWLRQVTMVAIQSYMCQLILNCHFDRETTSNPSNHRSLICLYYQRKSSIGYHFLIHALDTDMVSALLKKVYLTPHPPPPPLHLPPFPQPQ